MQNTAQLTVYRNGLINLNAEACRLLPATQLYIDLLPPAQHQQPWRLDLRPDAACKLIGRYSDRPGLYRFHAPLRAEYLFIGRPADVTTIVFQVLHTQRAGGLLTLREVRHLPPAVEQMILDMFKVSKPLQQKPV